MSDPMKPAEPAAAPPVDDEHRWAALDPLVKFGVVLAAILFCGVVVEGALLVPYALLTNGWTPGQ
jgi:hypothetical protein